MSTRVQHERIQHPVGQGGFHSGTVSLGAGRFTYVYDCGSVQLGKLERELRRFAEATTHVDALFLSHLDYDHVSGLDSLLGTLPVDTVFLPYLTLGERVAVAAETASRGVVPAAYLDFVEQPARWLSERGVRRIVLIGGSDGAIAAEISQQAPRDDGLSGTLSIDVDRLPVAPADVGKAFGPSEVQLRLVAPRAFPVSVQSTPVWWLIPFVHPEGSAADAFVAAVRREWPSLPKLRAPGSFRVWMNFLRTELRSRDFRDSLADLYGIIRKDRNLTSLVLLSTPAPQPRAIYPFSGTYWTHPRRRYGHLPGWLGTGDAHLERKIRAEALRNFYGNLLDEVGTIVLPHHGARRNISADFMSGFPARTWVAAYGNNSYGHPSETLVRDIARHGCTVHVSSDKRTTFIESFEFEY